MAEVPSGDHRARDIKTLEALARGMEGLNPNVLAALAHYGVNLSFCDGARITDFARIAREDIKRRQLPAKPGPRPKTSRAATLRELAAIYTAATGRPGKISVVSEAYKDSGKPAFRFFTFIRAAAALSPELNNDGDHALAKATQRATRTKRR